MKKAIAAHGPPNTSIHKLTSQVAAAAIVPTATAVALETTASLRAAPIQSRQAPIPPPSRQSVSDEMRAVKQCKALYDFTAESDTEISIRVGDIININEENDSGWWIGTVQGTNRTGLFPSNYTE
jgi:flagellar hook-length control protein FliK